MDVVHVAAIAGHIQPAGDLGAVGNAFDGGCVEPHRQAGQGIGLPFACHCKGYSACPEDLGVHRAPGGRNVGGGSRDHVGLADRYERARRAREGGTGVIFRLGSVEELRAAVETRDRLGEVGSRVDCAHVHVAVPARGGFALVVHPVVEGHGGGVRSIVGLEATDQGCSRGREGGCVGIVHRDDRGKQGVRGGEGDEVARPGFALGVLGSDT